MTMRNLTLALVLMFFCGACQNTSKEADPDQSRQDSSAPLSDANAGSADKDPSLEDELPDHLSDPNWKLLSSQSAGAFTIEEWQYDGDAFPWIHLKVKNTAGAYLDEFEFMPETDGETQCEGLSTEITYRFPEEGLVRLETKDWFSDYPCSCFEMNLSEADCETWTRECYDPYLLSRRDTTTYSHQELRLNPAGKFEVGEAVVDSMRIEHTFDPGMDLDKAQLGKLQGGVLAHYGQAFKDPAMSARYEKYDWYEAQCIGAYDSLSPADRALYAELGRLLK